MTTTVAGTNGAPQTVPATQVVGSAYYLGGCIWNMIPSTNSPPTFGNPQKLDTLVPGYGTTNAPWSGIEPASINDSGAIVGTATYSGTNMAIAAGSHGVILLPLSFVRETPVGSGTFTPIKDNGLDDKAQLPVFTTESGSGLAPTFSNSYSFTAQLSANLSDSSTASMVVAFTNSSGTFSGTVTETSAGSGVFQDSTNTITITLSPTTQTTSSSTLDTLNVTVTDSTLGLSSAPFTLVESQASSNYFSALLAEVVVTLPGTLSTTVVNTIQLSLGSNTNPENLQTSLTETAVNSRVFQDASGDSVTISSFTGETTMNVAISTSFLPVSSYTAALTETTSTSLQYANVQRTAGDAVVSTPSTDDEGVFYVQFPGSTATSITLVSGSNSVTTTASPVTGQPNLLRTGKLVLLNPGDTFSASGYTTLTVSPPSGGGKPTVQLQMYGQTIVDPGTVQNAFVAGIFHWYQFAYSLPAALDTVRQKILTLGWTTPFANDYMDKADVLAALPTHDFWFSFGHGHTFNEDPAQFDGFEVWNSRRVWDYADPVLHPSDISAANVNSDGSPHEYQFVFLDCCWSAGGGTGSTAMAQAFDADTYVGWTDVQDQGIDFSAADAFLDATTDHQTVQNGIRAGNENAAATGLGLDRGGRLTTIGDSTKDIDLK
jgi:hypothetical protein